MAIPVNGVEVIGSWLTPTVLFCILNLTILTIFILNPQKNQQQQSKLIRVPSLFERVTSINRSSEPQPDTNQPQLVRVPSLLERVKSIKFRTEPKPEEPIHVERTNSESSTVKKKKVRKVLRKSVSEKLPVDADEAMEKLRPATVREKTTSFHEDEAVDEKAGDFINRFRQQLKLQRLDSILRYKEMLNRADHGN